MQSSSGWYACVIFLLSVFVKTGLSLHCYKCQSGIGDTACEDDFLPTELEPEDCASGEVCFKTVTSIEDKVMEKVYTVTARGCAKTKQEFGCETVPQASLGKYTTCYCKKHKCNGAAAGNASMFVVAMTTGVIMAAMYIRSA